MKICIHVSFFFVPERIKYVNTIIETALSYQGYFDADIYIHTNNSELKVCDFFNYNGLLEIVCHNLTNMHPFLLTWKSRQLMKQQKNIYDAFIYVEDDICIPLNALLYWSKHNEYMIQHGYNLGFIRIDKKDDKEYVADLLGEKINEYINIDNITYAVSKNPYCAFWILNKHEFNDFTESEYYDLHNLKSLCKLPLKYIKYNQREMSAFGLHAPFIPWYKKTLIPIKDDKLVDECKVYHLPNNYANNPCNKFATILFDDALVKLQINFNPTQHKQ